MSAWRVNEHEKKTNATGGFLGAVPASPALTSLSLMPQSWILAGQGPSHDSVSIFLLQSLSTLYPSIKIDDYHGRCHKPYLYQQFRRFERRPNHLRQPNREPALHTSIHNIVN